MAKISTPFTELMGIERPISLAGMNVAAGPQLAAAVTNAGGLGVIGGLGYTPEALREVIHELKEDLNDKSAPFGVDLLLPKVGEGARKTNYDYTGGTLDKLIDVIIEEKAKLFVCAVGVPTRATVDRLHKAGIPVMNMVGHVKHVAPALKAGVDLICAQGGEGGGHTGDIASMILIPSCVDAVKGHTSSLTGQPVQVLGAGGIFDGRGLAACLAFGCSAVWVGTRFVAAEEAGASPKHQEALTSATFDDTVKTLIYTGRPLRVRKTDFIRDWEENKADEAKKMLLSGSIPVSMEDPEHRPFLMGQVAGAIPKVQPAKEIMDSMINEAAEVMKGNASLVGGSVISRLASSVKSKAKL